MAKKMFNELDELTKENIALALWMKEFKGGAACQRDKFANH